MGYLRRSYFVKQCLIFAIFSCVLVKFGKSAYPTTMKAILIEALGNPEVLRVKQVPVPTISYEQVLVKVKAIGVNPIDAHIRAGSYYMRPQLPTILGKEFAGIVEAVGANCTEFKEGDRVFCGVPHGAYAEYAVSNELDCYSLPEELSFAQGAALYVAYFTVFRGLVIRGHIKAKDLVLIHNAIGIIGSAGIQLAKYIGACIVASVGDVETEEIMKKSGADYIVYHTEDGYLNKMLQNISRPGFNAILEVLPYFNLRHDREYLIPTGRIITIGNRDNLVKYQKSVFSVSLFKHNQDEQKAASQCVLDGVRAGIIRPIITKEYSIDDAPEAHVHITYNNKAKGKIVFVL